MSRYLLESNKSKTSLNISVINKYVSKLHESCINTSSAIENNNKNGKYLPK